MGQFDIVCGSSDEPFSLEMWGKRVASLRRWVVEEVRDNRHVPTVLYFASLTADRLQLCLVDLTAPSKAVRGNLAAVCHLSRSILEDAGALVALLFSEGEFVSQDAKSGPGVIFIEDKGGEVTASVFPILGGGYGCPRHLSEGGCTLSCGCDLALFERGERD